MAATADPDAPGLVSAGKMLPHWGVQAAMEGDLLSASARTGRGRAHAQPAPGENRTKGQIRRRRCCAGEGSG